MTALAVALLAGATGPASAASMKPGDIVGAIAFLMRVEAGACPGITFDPTPMLGMLGPGLTVAQIRSQYRSDFLMSYNEAGSRVASEGMPAYCDFVASFFGRARPGEFPGLVIR
ncbi:hypothetical protein [Phreatobacter stygius]|uniref:Uncharacterized protein n=1 Tax=Phreatobacter stygius TaxID=1940610 RepID=A0A4D7B8L2_9HYPH|nr:hypothetical protein [Phreatobacter stygius]QCI67183.1 hypothetical protein E8M01_24880 [Phreatobacter stygius]